MVGSGWVFDDGRETMDDGQKQPYIFIAPNYGRLAFVVSGLWSVVPRPSSVVCGPSSLVLFIHHPLKFYCNKMP